MFYNICTLFFCLFHYFSFRNKMNSLALTTVMTLMPVTLCQSLNVWSSINDYVAFAVRNLKSFTYLFIHLSICLFIYLFIHLLFFFYLHIYLSIYLFICLFHLFTYLFINLFIYLFVSFIHLSIKLLIN